MRGLETTATLDMKTDEWVINTPKFSSAKFWPGDLGKTGTHAVVYAQMIIDEQPCGVSCFMIPIRDMETHEMLPGIEAGDIGPKFGFHGKDNGYAIFKNVRIPREDMLMRYMHVNKEGEVSMKGNPKVLYSIMMMTRLNLIKICPNSLAAALQVSVRYCL